jgi:glutamine cyclotransferase
LNKQILSQPSHSLQLTLLLLLTIIWAPVCISDTIEYDYKVLQSFPHDRSIFTQGLEFHQGQLYESAGQRGQSRILRRQLNDVTPLQQQPLADNHFAEGITVLNNKLYQLTWQSQRGFIYQPDTLKKLGEFSIDGEGWGLSNNGTQLIISNGSAQLQFVDPDNFKVVKTVNVSYGQQPVNRLNELEWVDGLIYANIWQSDWIVMIDPDNGTIVGKVLLRGLLAASLKDKRSGVLNGIAYDKEQQRLFVTGKNWPRVYQLELSPKLK